MMMGRFAERYYKCDSFIKINTPAIFLLMFMVAIGIHLYAFGSYYLFGTTVVMVAEQWKAKHTVDERFLSFGIDAKLLAEGATSVDLRSPRLRNLTSLISPAYLRLGGTLSDRLLFQNESSEPPFFNLSAHNWIQWNLFAQNTNSIIVFDLNALLRDGNGDWDSTNAQQIIRFSHKNGFNVHWQLGNEPNSFPHIFNVSISPRQLSKDFVQLKRLLKSINPNYQIIGPDTTRPQYQRPECLKYMVEFLEGLARLDETLDAISWHQYYLNGRLATLRDFWNPDTFDLLKNQIDIMLKNVKNLLNNAPMWLSETNSAYGGGAPGLSDSFAGSPLWIDKLGLSARKGLKAVIRQSLIGGDYSLLDFRFRPLPDWWVSYLYKKLVGFQVLECSESIVSSIRIYCHCASIPQRKNNSVTFFGSNLSELDSFVKLDGSAINNNLIIDEYILKSATGDRTSRMVTLNDALLEYNGFNPELHPITVENSSVLRMPGYSVGFWVVHNMNMQICI